MKGLSNKWSQGKIYCSYLSKNLIVNRFPGLKNWVIDLEMDEEHWIYLDEEKKEGVQVVLIDACHCPGAVMFLFRGKMGTVLHTGDFRFSETMLKNEWLCPKEKRNTFMKAITVDVDYLHLDNTFANPEYDFPSREEAYLSLVKIVKSHIEHRIFLFSYSLGKEEVLLLLAEEFKCKIVVDEERMAKVKLLELSQEVFTTDQNASKIHIKQIRELPKYDIN